ncbi:MAG TPA: aspartyl/asparaginyl beta-hydroxylase domain-containing protein [Caulobacteraceae bacterium]|jgi:aspartyl/asparaginyl beta-hydroxylase (cupin superfamily)|nr:aspartyl/asparaginyl beta-hydroxylase domain-containing protein [Caulobacteraceae bacterium]
MVFDENTRQAETLKNDADRALRGGDPRLARAHFQRATALAPDRIDLWMGLAACNRAVGDHSASLAAIDNALARQPRFFPAHLMKGALLEALDLPSKAAASYGIALQLAPPSASLAEPTRRALGHAEDVHRTHVDRLAAMLKAEIGFGSAGARTALDRRADIFIESMVGRRRIYHQEPVKLNFPGLPAIEFYERDEFDFLEALEAQTSVIREEVLAVWTDGSEGLTPYVDYPPGAPLDQWAELNHSMAWSAYHLWFYGEPVDANCAKCPRTMAALELIDMPSVPARSPAAMYSILRPHTRIPPHTGVANTRLVLHLPLIVPYGCGFRVGGESRPWREGEAWVFDDTIEHEAWNDSDKPRAILIADVWSPRLSGEERELIVTLCAALDRFQGGTDVGDGL